MLRQRKSYESPFRPWDKERIDREKILIKDYGLRRKKEIRRAESHLRKYRRLARSLAASQDRLQEKMLVEKLHRLGLIHSGSGLDDILALTIDKVLDRRLQTIVCKKGLATTMKQARQFITHGHIEVDGQSVTWPSMIVPIEKETKIKLYKNSRLKESLAKAAEKITKKEIKEIKKEAKPEEKNKTEPKEEAKPEEKAEPKEEKLKEEEKDGE